jgi:secreted Zn-dependent insulinase-like peptidase
LPPLEITFSINKVFTKALESMKECKEEGYKNNIQSIRSILIKKDNNLNERVSKIWKEIDLNTKDFNRNKNLLRALDDLDVAKIMDMFKNVFFEHPR